MNLQIGSKGPEVGNWQRFLNDYQDAGLAVDESYGPLSMAATLAYQQATSLNPSGLVDSATYAQGVTNGFFPFIQAKNFTQLWPGGRKSVEWVVVHTMEHGEKPKTAFNVASWFAGVNAPMASAHFCIDDRDTIQCVRETDVAWHAPGANALGIGIEHAGFASQTPMQWSDDYSKKVLENSARLAASIAQRWGIPILKRTPDELKAGLAGFCGHVDVTSAFSRGIGHWDPGPAFPWEDYLNKVKSYVR